MGSEGRGIGRETEKLINKKLFIELALKSPK